MITFIVAGLGLLVLLAVVVGIVDRATAAKRRYVAGERRQEFEARRAARL